MLNEAENICNLKQKTYEDGQCPQAYAHCLTSFSSSENALCLWAFSHFIDGRQGASVLSEWAYYNKGEISGCRSLSCTEIS